MEKSVYAILLCLCTVFSGFAQNGRTFTINVGKNVSINTGTPIKQREIGKSVMEFMYDYRYLTDTTDIRSAVTDRMILQVGSELSKFTSYRMMQIDSLIRISSADQMKANPARYAGGETFSVYKNYPAGKFSIMDKVATDWFFYEEEPPVQHWTITEATKEILGYSCKGATCHFRGRDYIAYYTDEIPVAGGPWKFGGLPGFILEVSDVSNHYSFVCVGINSKAKRLITMPEVQYNKTTRSKFYQTKHKYDVNPMEYMQAVSGVKINIVTPDGTPRTDMNQPAKLLYDYIERDWR